MSDLEQKNNILYRPSLGIPKNYYSDGTLNYPEIDADNPEVTLSKETLEDKIKALKPLFLFIPGEIKPQTESILNLVHFLLTIIEKPDGDEGDVVYDIIKPDENPDIVDKPGQNTSTDKPHSNIEDTTKAPIDSFFKDHKPITILKQSISEETKIKRHYSNSTLEITMFYVSKLADILATYNAQLFAYPKVVDYLGEVYKTSLIDYKNHIAHSILQTLLKSQQEKISKMRLYQKLYNEKQCLTILKSLEYSKLTLLKMVSNAPKEPKLFYKHVQTVETEKKRLDKKMFEYYRYLDSSLEVLEECLNMHLTEGIAKAELHKLNNEKENKNDTTS